MKRNPRTLAEFFQQDGAPTQDAIAKKLGVTPAYISLIASGQRQPSLSLAIRLADLTGIPTQSLVSPDRVAS